MTIAYWCVLIIVTLPYIWGLSARIPGITLEKNLVPRVTAESFSGLHQRLYWAHLNALEATAPFAAAVIIAHLQQVNQSTIDSLAISFVVLRIAHALSYIANKGVLRTLVFIAGMACIVMLFVSAA